MSYSFMFAYSENDNPYITAFYQDKSNLVTSDPISFKPGDDITGSKKIIANVYPKFLSPRQDFGVSFGYLFDGYFIGITSGKSPIGVAAHSGASQRFHDDL